MAGLEDVLGSILSSPEGVGKMMDVMKLLGGDATKPQEEAEKKESEETLPTAFMGGMDGLDPNMMLKIADVIKEYNSDADRRIRLLDSLRPFLKDEDSYHIDRAVRIIKLSHVAKSAFKNFLK